MPILSTAQRRQPRIGRKGPQLQNYLRIAFVDAGNPNLLVPANWQNNSTGTGIASFDGNDVTITGNGASNVGFADQGFTLDAGSYTISGASTANVAIRFGSTLGASDIMALVTSTVGSWSYTFTHPGGPLFLRMNKTTGTALITDLMLLLN